MYVYSTWVATDAPNALVDSFAEAVGPPTETGDGERHSRLLSWEADFNDQDDSVWARSETTGRWTVGIADLGAGEQADPRLVGVLSGSPALAQALVDSFTSRVEEQGYAHEPAYFPLGQLVEGNEVAGLELIAVRVQDEVTRTLVQGTSEEALRANLSLLPGEVVGATLTSEDARVTLLQDGTVIFADSTSLSSVLDSMGRVIRATGAFGQAPEPAPFVGA